jgi:hypothetical protein
MEAKMDIDSILEKELVKLVTMQGADTAIGRAARRLPTIASRKTVIYKASLEHSAESARTAIKGASGFREMLDNPEDAGETMLFAVVGSGVKNMNPAVICATLEYVDDKTTKIHIVGSAKEGLIKQKTAEKAVRRVVEGLQSLHASE